MAQTYRMNNMANATASEESLARSNNDVKRNAVRIQEIRAINDDRDDQEMAYLGKKQQLRRNFGFISMLGFSCSIMITWEVMISVLQVGLANGGPAGLIYGYLLCWFGFFAIVLSLCEMVSMAPTAGGQYYWAYVFASRSSRRFLSFITGWISVLAWQALMASAAYLGGTMIQGLLVLNYPGYGFERWHGTLLLYAVNCLAIFFNTYLAIHMPKVQALVLIFHIVGYFAILITITYLAPHGDARTVFTEFISLGGYNRGMAFFVGLITTVFAFTGVDGTVHMCEEIRNASTIVPFSLIASIILNGALGFTILIAILFCVGDIDTALDSPTHFPFIEIFRQATQSIDGSNFTSSIIVFMMISTIVAQLAATSRVTWAFARDNGLPGSTYLAKVEPRSKLPLWSIGTSAAITFALGLLNIGSSVAFNAIISLTVASFLASYIVPTALLLRNRIKGAHPSGKPIKYGPFALGRWGIPVNALALVFSVLVMVSSFFPDSTDVTAETMNWSGVMWVGSMLIGVVFYFAHQNKVYQGPVVEIHNLDGVGGV